LPPVIIDDILFKKQKIKAYSKLRKSYSENNLYHHVPDYPGFCHWALSTKEIGRRPTGFFCFLIRNS